VCYKKDKRRKTANGSLNSTLEAWKVWKRGNTPRVLPWRSNLTVFSLIIYIKKTIPLSSVKVKSNFEYVFEKISQITFLFIIFII
jgi:hypothetical protein